MSDQLGSATLIHSGREVESIFELFGFKEDDISQAISWSLKGSPSFLTLLLVWLGWKGGLGDVVIHFQRYEATRDEAGRTDIELQSPGRYHIILEAKRGWILPGKEQLAKYANRRSFRDDEVSFKCLATLSECSEEYAGAHLPAAEIDGVPVRHLSWQTITNLAREALATTSRPAEKRLLKQLLVYFGRIMRVQRVDSNLVYVVSLGTKVPPEWDVSWIDIVEKYDRYFHPMTRNWPKEPPAYIGFRYRGQLQSIHFIEDYEVIYNLQVACDGIPDWPLDDPHYLYDLGPAIRPKNTVKTGKIYPSGRVWAAIDTLLVCDTVSEARDVTKQRLEGTT